VIAFILLEPSHFESYDRGEEVVIGTAHGLPDGFAAHRQLPDWASPPINSLPSQAL
jgi:hypothetical protein